MISLRSIFVLGCSLLLAFTSLAQRKVTPVEPEQNKNRQPKLYYYDKHGNPLKEPVEFLTELDTVARPSAAPKYPLLNSMSFGLNFFDAVMLIAGQKHASFDISADISLHNWFFPTIEAGIGFAHSKPATGNFTYTGKPSFYAKIGLNYNFLYKSSPDYQVFIGLRAGFSSFNYDISDISVSVPYWGQTDNFSILRQKASVFYGEILAGVKVKIVRNFSLGWTIRYHTKFHTRADAYSSPWFVPGYGTTSPISFSFSAIYTLPFPHKDPSLIKRSDSSAIPQEIH